MPRLDRVLRMLQSMQWIDKYKQGLSVEEIMVSAIKNMHQNEQQNNLWL